MDTGIDLNTQTHYEVKQSGEQREAQDIVNSVLEKENQRKEFIIKLTRKTLLDYGISIEKINSSNFGVDKNISINLYSNGDGNLFKYSKENGIEYYTGLDILKSDNITKYANQVGYDIKNGKIYKNGKIIEKIENGEVNGEYIKAIDNINFQLDIWNIGGWTNAIYGGIKLEEGSWDEALKKSIIGGVIRIKDVILFKGAGYINDKEFSKLLLRAIRELPNQCSELRYYETIDGKRMGMEVTKQELSQYLRPKEGEPLITQKVYDECIKLIDKRDELINIKKETLEQSKVDIKIEKEKKTVLDKISDLLGWN